MMDTTSAPVSDNKYIFWVMSAACGASVANIYYCQPLLLQMQESFQATPKEVGWIPTLTQFGYALGMLFLIPLGDRFEKRGLIFISTILSALSLVLMAWSPNLWIACLSSLLIGVTTMTPQFLIPLAAQMSQPAKRGQVLGFMLSGVFLGILLARTISGFVGAAQGWRWMFSVAAVAMFLLAAVLRGLIPITVPTFHGSYKSLLGSVFALIRQYALLREAMVIGACLFGAFSGFWATLIYLVESPGFQLGPRTVGLLGLLGAVGALMAPLLGHFADKKGPRTAIAIGTSLAALAYGIFWVWGSTSLIALGIGVVIIDVGIQGAHVANQSRVFALAAEARSRLNTAYMFAYFVGGAVGSSLASFAWAQLQWNGVCAVGLGLILFAFVFFLRARPANLLHAK